MSSPLPTGKKSVNLSAPVRGSRIRRDPPPPVKKVVVRDPEVRETRMVVFGVVGFAIALFIVALAASVYSGWSPGDYSVHANLD